MLNQNSSIKVLGSVTWPESSSHTSASIIIEQVLMSLMIILMLHEVILRATA